MTQNDFLIVGLGNPGKKYEDTRHNVGFLIVDELVRRWGEGFSSEKWNAMWCRMRRWDTRLTIIKPTTYMNLSGRSVAEFAKFYKVPPQNIVVIHDDLDMTPGRLKLVCGGGAGGHNGIRSITESIGSNAFLRLKVGIGRPGKNGVHPDVPVENYVLSALSGEEQSLLTDRYDILEEGMQRLIVESPAKAMNLINSVK